MKSKLISSTRGPFEEDLNKALLELKDNEIIDVKFTQGTLNNAVILSALILYK